MTESAATWLPNLIGGVSIWKLAVDLNEPKFMGGRLLVPETEGSESLPVTVRWELGGLVPLAEARQTDPIGTSAAIAEFQACLERTAKVFATPNSGYDKYKQAFTVPALDADGGANYFYAATEKKLFVANWGASPRAMGARSEFVFGWEDWGKVFAGAAGAGTLAAAAGALGAPAEAEGAQKASEDAKKGDDESENKKPGEPAKRAWWAWPLFAVVAIAAILLALLLLKSCEDEKAAKGLADASADGATLLDGSADAAGGNASADAASADAAGGDAGVDAAGAFAGQGAASGDGGRDGGRDGGLAMDDDDDDDEPAGGGTIVGGSSGGTGTVVVEVGPAGGAAGPKTGPHRRHYQAEAVAWRVVAGKDRVARTEQRGRRFDVWLGGGRTFDGVRVEWKDKGGKWHVH